MDLTGGSVETPDDAGATESGSTDRLGSLSMRQMTNIGRKIVRCLNFRHVHLRRDTAASAVPVVASKEFHVAELPLRHGDFPGDPERGTALLRQRHENLKFVQVP